MKRFEFRLKRVLELRRQQSELEKGKLQSLKSTSERLDQYRAATTKRIEDARTFVEQSEATMSEDLSALSTFESHMRRAITTIGRQREQLDRQITEQRDRVVEAERKVKLLEKLEARQLSGWTICRDKELEELAADSYLARLTRRRAESE